MKLKEFLTEEAVTPQQIQTMFQKLGQANVNQLTTAWNNAGKPTDLGQVRTLLTNLKIPPNVIAQAMQAAGVGSTAQPAYGAVQKTFDPKAAAQQPQQPQQTTGQLGFTQAGQKVLQGATKQYKPTVPHYNL